MTGTVPTQTPSQSETVTDALEQVSTRSTYSGERHALWLIYPTLGLLLLGVIFYAILYFTRPPRAINSVPVLPFVNDSKIQTSGSNNS